MGQVAAIWDSANGMRGLRDVVVDDYGLDVSTWQFTSAIAISANGMVVVGHGVNPAGESEAFMLTFADCNANGVPDHIDMAMGVPPCNSSP